MPQVTASDYEQSSYSHSGSYSNHIHKDDENSWSGTVDTQFGIVNVFAWDPPKESKIDPATSITAIVEGQMITRRWKKCYRPRFIVTLAKRMMRDIHKSKKG